MKRSDFIKQVAGALSLSSFNSGTGIKHVTILYTNDTHSHIDPFEISHHRFPGKDRVSRRATLVQQVRNENPNTLLFDTGDIFQGTTYFNYFGG